MGRWFEYNIISSKPIDYYLSKNLLEWEKIGSGASNQQGISSILYTPLVIPGNYIVESSFIEDDYYLSSTTIGDMTILPEPTQIQSFSAENVEYTDIPDLKIKLTDLENNVLAGKPIRFLYRSDSGEWKLLEEGVTNDQGLVAVTEVFKFPVLLLAINLGSMSQWKFLKPL